MKIGICGSQSVGKTTLLNALRSEPSLSDYTIRNELTRQVHKLGFPINENGSDLTQHQIILEHFYNLMMFDKMITDRTLVDAAVYTTWLWKNGKVSQRTYIEAFNALQRNADAYDIMFFIEPEFPVEDDGTRSVDPDWQKEINELFIAILNSFGIKYTKLTGSVVNRVSQVLEAIRKEENNE